MLFRKQRRTWAFSSTRQYRCKRSRSTRQLRLLRRQTGSRQLHPPHRRLPQPTNQLPSRPTRRHIHRAIRRAIRPHIRRHTHRPTRQLSTFAVTAARGSRRTSRREIAHGFRKMLIAARHEAKTKTTPTTAVSTNKLFLCLSVRNNFYGTLAGPVACRTCPFACSGDSEFWYRSSPDEGCEWVAETMDRCRERSADGDVPAYVACESLRPLLSFHLKLQAHSRVESARMLTASTTKTGTLHRSHQRSATGSPRIVWLDAVGSGSTARTPSKPASRRVLVLARSPTASTIQPSTDVLRWIGTLALANSHKTAPLPTKRVPSRAMRASLVDL